MKAILLDIEGTTTPIDFVHKTLFPFARARVDDFIADYLTGSEIDQLSREYKKDFADQLYGRDFRSDALDTVANYIKFLIDVDRKSTPLKSFQGRIWQKGYESGELRSEMFADVPRAFERWKKQGIKIDIFSSGSLLAQILIFEYSNFGDLTKFIDGFFDTTIGSKKETESYQKLAREIGCAAHEILFVSDVLAELDAARDAGMQTALAVREGNGQITEDLTHRSVTSFDEIDF